MAVQNTSSLFSRAVMLVLAVIIAIVVLSVVLSILKALFGLLVFAAIVGGLVYLFNKLRG